MITRLPRWFIALFGILALAALLRLGALHTIPPGLHADEAANLMDIDEIRNGLHPIYFPRNTGREPLFIYWQALVVAALGPNAYALRVAAALIGLATVPVVAFAAWTLGRAERRERADRDALLAALALTGLYWHVHFSRIGLRTISLALLVTITFGLWWLAVHRPSPVRWALTGVVSGLTLYTYTSSRVVPLMLAITGLLLLRQSRQFWRGLVIAALCGITVAMPLARYAMQHPDETLGHTADVSVLNPAVNHGDFAGALTTGLVKTAGMFLIAGSLNPVENLPGRPLLDPLVGIVFLLGLIGSLKQIGRPTRAGLLIWLGLGVLPSTLSVNPPGYFRISAAIPAIAILVGIGGGMLWDWLAARSPATGRRVAGFAVVAVLLASTGWTAWDYFVRWGPSPIAYQALRGDHVDAARLLVQWARTDRVFLAPLYAQDLTFQYLTRSAPPDTFDLGAALVIPGPTDRDVRYVFPPFDREQLALVRQRLPVAARLETTFDRYGQPLLSSLIVAGRDLPPRPDRWIATLGDVATVVDVVQIGPARAGSPLTVAITWLARQRTPVDYTVFLHLRDRADRTRSQYDRQPARGTFPTSHWQPGDRLTEWYQIDLPTDLPPGRYRLVGGLYELQSLQRLPVRAWDGQDLGNEVPLGEIVISAP